jgi:hypothetical protein
MTIVTQKFKHNILALSVVFAVSACGGSDKVDTLLDDLIPKDKSVNITFVNAVDEMASFYVQIRDLQRSIFSDEDKASDIAANEMSSPYEHAWGESLNNTTFGVQDTNSQSKRRSVDYELNDNSDVFAVAWLSGTDYRLSVFEKQASNTADIYSVRVFANSQMSVKINDSDQVVTTTEIGEVTEKFEINNCATGLQIGENYIDLCTVDLGESYLVVADSNGKRVITQE